MIKSGSQGLFLLVRIPNKEEQMDPTWCGKTVLIARYSAMSPACAV